MRGRVKEPGGQRKNAEKKIKTLDFIKNIKFEKHAVLK